MEAAISVNSVMLWDRWTVPSEFRRVLAPGGRLVITVHRRVLVVPPEDLEEAACAADFTDVRTPLRAWKRNGPAVEPFGPVPA